MELSLRDRAKFRRISWLMAEVNVRDVLARLGLRVEHSSGNEIRSFCPDHHVYTGTNPSHANWTVNVKTGETMCFTEGRGSNLVFVVARALDVSAGEAAAFLKNEPGESDTGAMSLAAIRSRQSQIRVAEERPAVKGLDTIAEEMANRHLSDDAYGFFIHPPEKVHPTNFLPETLDHYMVFERTWGYYSGRVVIPFVMRKFIEGFCALDMFGKKEWLRRHPTKTKDDYRKVLYPMNQVSGNILFGFDDCEDEADVLVVAEGPREVMKLWQEGFTNSVAILGSHMSDVQMMLLTGLHPKRVALMFDGDKAGMATTERIACKLRQFEGDRLMRCSVPQGMDPKNLAREDFEKMLAA